MENIYQQLTQTSPEIDTNSNEYKYLLKNCVFQIHDEPAVRLSEGQPLLNEYITFTLYSPRCPIPAIFTSNELVSLKSGIHQLYMSIQLQDIPNFHRIQSLVEYHPERQTTIPGYLNIQPLPSLTLDKFIHQPICNLDTFLQIIVQTIHALHSAYTECNFNHRNLTPKHIYIQEYSNEVCIKYSNNIYVYTKYVAIISGYHQSTCKSNQTPSKDIYHLLIICMYIASKVNTEVYSLYPILFPDSWTLGFTKRPIYNIYTELETHISKIMSAFVYQRCFSKKNMYQISNHIYKIPPQKQTHHIQSIVSYKYSTTPNLRQHSTFIHEYQRYLRNLLWTLNCFPLFNEDLQAKLNKCYTYLRADIQLVKERQPNLYYEIQLIITFLGKYEKLISV